MNLDDFIHFEVEVIELEEDTYSRINLHSSLSDNAYAACFRRL